MTINRQFVESPMEQGVEEEIRYVLTTTPWGSSPTSVTVKAYTIAEGPTYVDVSATVLSGSPSVTGDEITLPTLRALTDGTRYRIEVKFTSGSNVFEPYGIVQCKR